MTDVARTHVCDVRVAADHPSLPGHFPGRPIAPGVLLLDRVLEAAEQWLAQPIEVAGLTQAKFTTPLAPEQSAVLEMTLRDLDLRFVLTHGQTLIAQGAFKLRRAVRT